uniref:Uncharacterized protein n=1 Tax=Rhizophora mucronata TaxID=61149 RepID=A0A2P2PVI7_RHIMU
MHFFILTLHKKWSRLYSQNMSYDLLEIHVRMSNSFLYAFKR